MFTKGVIGTTVTNKIGQCVRTFIEIIAKEIKKEIYEKVLFKEESKKLCHDLSHILLIHHNSRCTLYYLTGGIFETGAYGVPSKSQNSTVLCQGGPSSTQYSNPSWA
jgi:hypothetical protein